jgi:hypothetical protein
MEGAVLADGVTQQQVEDVMRRVAEGAVAMNHRGRVRLEILADEPKIVMAMLRMRARP